MGAKGLQAEHVFVLGLNGGHFPTSNQSPLEAEVCELLVALARAREKCTLVSVRNFGGEWLDDSVFIEWLEPLLDSVTVDKAYFSGAQE
jgi:superfamily I DNA/RNA helicase